MRVNLVKLKVYRRTRYDVTPTSAIGYAIAQLKGIPLLDIQISVSDLKPGLGLLAIIF
jgi:hypothetical protein